MVLGLLVVYNDSSQCQFSIRSIEFVDLLSHNIIRVHSNHGWSHSDHHVLQLDPIIHASEVLSFQLSAHRHNRIRFIVPRAVDLIDFGERASWLLSKAIVILLQPVLHVVLLDHFSDDIMSLGWLCQPVLTLAQSLMSSLLGSLGRSVVIDSSISWDSCSGVSN